MLDLMHLNRSGASMKFLIYASFFVSCVAQAAQTEKASSVHDGLLTLKAYSENNTFTKWIKNEI